MIRTAGRGNVVPRGRWQATPPGRWVPSKVARAGSAESSDLGVLKAERGEAEPMKTHKHPDAKPPGGGNLTGRRPWAMRVRERTSMRPFRRQAFLKKNQFR